MKQYIVPVEATIRFNYLVEASDAAEASRKLDGFIAEFDQVDKDVESVEIYHGCDDVDFNSDDIHENTGEYSTEDLRKSDDSGIWLASYLH